MIEPKFTREELEARQQARGEISIDTVRERYPNTYSYEAFLKSTRIVQEVKDLLTTRQ